MEERVGDLGLSYKLDGYAQDMVMATNLYI